MGTKKRQINLGCFGGPKWRQKKDKLFWSVSGGPKMGTNKRQIILGCFGGSQNGDKKKQSFCGGDKYLSTRTCAPGMGGQIFVYQHVCPPRRGGTYLPTRHVAPGGRETGTYMGDRGGEDKSNLRAYGGLIKTRRATRTTYATLTEPFDQQMARKTVDN